MYAIRSYYEHSGETLLAILNDILDLSKIEAGRLELETIDFDLRETVEGAVDLFSEKAFSKNVELICLLSPGIPTALQGDPVRLRQILFNLIGNRITSYNVCYTKLLRKRGIEPWCNHHIRKTIRIKKIVITSYSIHYTKLYEIAPHP